ncbi:hypothetical protein BH10CHL1_BH10CHL1_13440 [soil metagenome]
MVRLRNYCLGLIMIGGLLAGCGAGLDLDNTSAPLATPVPTLATLLSPTPTITATTVATVTAAQSGPSYPGKIAYTGVEKNSVNIYVMTADRSYQKQLTKASGVSFQPQWSHDGKLLAYFHYDSQKDVTTIWVADSAGDPEPRLVSPPAGVKTADTLSWSADDHFLVYQDLQPNSNQRDIYRLDITNGELVNLTTDSPKFDTSPTWSPDGQWIAFVSDRTNATKGSDSIWLMTPDGKNLKNLTTEAGDWENTKPAWSPDGEQLAFYRWTVQKDFKASGGPAGLWVINADGSQAKPLVDFTEWLPSDAPVWSPDGKLIAFDYGNKDDTNVWVVPAQGGKPLQISKLPGGEKHISWSPDSKAFVFTNLQQDVFTLYLAQPDHADPQAIFETNGNGFGDWSR